jgi:hypothetical protein
MYALTYNPSTRTHAEALEYAAQIDQAYRVISLLM